MSESGIMFHHFYDDDKHLRGQGAISKIELEKLIDYLKDYNILNAEDWLKKALVNNLKENDVCLTFDDGLKCQYDVALPVLESKGLTGFWFVYSSVFHGNIGRLELYRYYRTSCFSSIDIFYEKFLDFLSCSNFSKLVEEKLNKLNINEYLSDFPIYSFNDRKFRLIRDKILGQDSYFHIMDNMIKDSNMPLKKISEILWMNNKCLLDLHSKGNIIGLHSYTHPTELSNLSKNEQKEEYFQNYDHIHQLLNIKPVTVSHPCNSYNQNTIEVLKEMGIQLGFRSNNKLSNHSMYEFPREDHSILMKQAGMRDF